MSSANRRMVTLESNLAHATEAIAAELTGLDARVDQLAGRMSALDFCDVLVMGNCPL